MFKSITQRTNKLIDWFIPESEKMEFSDLYVNRRFIEAIIVVVIVLLLALSLKIAGIRESFPSEIALAITLAILILNKIGVKKIITGNLFIGFFYFALSYGIVSNEIEITAYFRWYIVLPMFSMLFINKNSTLFWSALIILTNFALFYVDYPATTILHDYQHKLYFFSDTGIFFSFIMLLIYIYFISKDLIDQKLVSEQAAIKKQAANLIKMQRQLMEKNNELQTYAYVVSHDLKSPIRGILSFSELLKMTIAQRGLNDPEIDKQLSFISENAIQMEELVTDILRYAELSNDTSKEFKDTNLNELLSQTIKNIPFETKINKIAIHEIDLPIIKVLPTQTKQIFQNLISNSIKFAHSSRALEINIYEEDHDDYVLFKFQDNGIGIKEENLANVFLPFKRFNYQSTYSGSGIGLANCDKVVKRHHGEIWAESVLGEGTTISFTLSKKIPT